MMPHVAVFYVFLSSCLNPEWIGDVAVGFYLEARLQGKSCRHSNKDEVSNRKKGFSWFFFKYLQPRLLGGGDDVANRGAAVSVEPGIDAADHLDGDGRVEEVGRANLNSAGAGHEELDGVLCR